MRRGSLGITLVLVAGLLAACSSGTAPAVSTPVVSKPAVSKVEPLPRYRVTLAPSALTPEQLFEARDLAVTTDFRDLFAEVARRHLAIPGEAPLFPGFAAKSTGYPGVLM